MGDHRTESDGSQIVFLEASPVDSQAAGLRAVFVFLWAKHTTRKEAYCQKAFRSFVRSGNGTAALSGKY